MPATDSLSLAQDVADFSLSRQSARQAMHCLAKKSASPVDRCGHAFLAACSMFFLGVEADCEHVLQDALQHVREFLRWELGSH